MTSPKRLCYCLTWTTPCLTTTECKIALGVILSTSCGIEARDRYFAILEDLYAELGYGTIWEPYSVTGLRTSAIADC